MHAHELVTLRHVLGLTPSALAKAVGVSLSAMQCWERTEQEVPPQVSRTINQLLTAKIHRANHP